MAATCTSSLLLSLLPLPKIPLFLSPLSRTDQPNYRFLRSPNGCSALSSRQNPINGRFIKGPLLVRSQGIGYALAKEFLKTGDNVIICSRSAERVESAVQSLGAEFGDLHVWINNAGSNAYSYKSLAEASDEDLIEVVTTNTLGLMICCREAIKMMRNQPRGGHIFFILMVLVLMEKANPKICCLWSNETQCGASDQIITG